MDESASPGARDAARANRELYRAFERLDLAAMRGLWLDDESVVCVHPGGEIIAGFERVISSFEAIFGSTDSIRFEIADLSVSVEGDVARVHAVEVIRAGEGASAERSETAATNVFVRRGGAWRLVLHHASPIVRRFFRK